VQIVRLYDPGRRPADWTEIIRDGQFAVFAKDDEAGVPCDLDGARFANAAAVTCAIVDSIDEARAVCDAAVARHAGVRCEVFDAGGRTRPPLLTVTHPLRSSALETSPRQMRTRRAIAWSLIAAGLPLLAYAYAAYDDHDTLLAVFLGINMVLIGLRLLWMNLALRETERVRAERLARASKGGPAAR
jgi:hypothetical protein